MADKEILIDIKVDNAAAIKNIEKQSKEVTNLKEQNKELNEINKKLAKEGKQLTKEYQDNAKAIALNNSRIAVANKSRKESISTIKTVNNSYGAMKSRLKDVSIAIDKVDLSTKRGRQSVSRLRQEQNKLNTALKNGEAAGNSFSRNVGNYKTALSSAAGSITSFNFAILASPIGGFVAALTSLVLVGRQAFNFFKEYEVVMSKVKAVTQSSNEEFQLLRDSTIEYGESSKFTAKEVASLQLELAKLGKTTPEIIDMTGAILDLAIATDSELGETASIVAKTLNQFGLSAKDTIRVTDVMAQSFVSSALDINKFEEAMKKAGPIARLSGKSFEETTAIIASLTDAGVDASTIGTSLRDVFSDLAKSGETWDSALDRIKNSTNRVKTANEIFGKTSLTVTALLSENIDRVDDLTNSLNNAEGAASAMAEIVGNNLQGDLDRLSSSWEGLIARGGWLNKVFRYLVIATKQFIDDIKDIPLAVERMAIVSKNMFRAMVITVAEAVESVADIVGVTVKGASKTIAKLNKEQEEGSKRVSEINQKLEDHRLRQIKELAAVSKEAEDSKKLAALENSKIIIDNETLEAEKKRRISDKQKKQDEKDRKEAEEIALKKLERDRKNDEDLAILKLEKKRDALTDTKEIADADIAILQEKYSQENQSLREKLAEENGIRLEQLNTQLSNGSLKFASLEQLDYDYAQKVIQINEDTEKKINDLKDETSKKDEKRTKKELDLKVKSAKYSLDIITQVLNTASSIAGENFEIQKALSIGQAIINTAQGVTQAFAQGGPLGFATGAAVAAAGAVQVSKIISTTPDSSGGGGVAAITGNAPTTQTPIDTSAADTSQADNEALEAAISRIGLSVSVSEINEAQVLVAEAESGSSI